MALGDPYASAEELGAYLELQAGPMQAKADLLEEAVQAASSSIENFCRRQFNRVDVASARLYQPLNWKYTKTDDFWSTDDLRIRVAYSSGAFGSDWTPDQYRLHPLNGVVNGLPGRPFRKIALNSVTWTFGNGELVEVTAKWGWETVPDEVHQSALILGAKYFAMRKAPGGEGSGFSESGGVLKVGSSSDAYKLLKELRLGAVMVA